MEKEPPLDFSQASFVTQNKNYSHFLCTQKD